MRYIGIIIDIFLVFKIYHDARKGYQYGFLRPLVSLISFLVAIIGSYVIYAPLYLIIGNVVYGFLDMLAFSSALPITEIVVYAIGFLCILALASYICHHIEVLDKLPYFSTAQRTVGAMLGVILFAFKITCIIFLLYYASHRISFLSVETNAIHTIVSGSYIWNFLLKIINSVFSK